MRRERSKCLYHPDGRELELWVQALLGHSQPQGKRVKIEIQNSTELKVLCSERGWALEHISQSTLHPWGCSTFPGLRSLSQLGFAWRISRAGFGFCFQPTAGLCLWDLRTKSIGKGNKCPKLWKLGVRLPDQLQFWECEWCKTQKKTWFYSIRPSKSLHFNVWFWCLLWNTSNLSLYVFKFP